jgi:hypothetical protein
LDQRRGRVPPRDQEQEGTADLRDIMSSTKWDSEVSSNPAPASPARQQARPRTGQPPAASQGWAAHPAARSPAQAGVTLSDADLQQLKKITSEVKAQKDANLKKEAELHEKEEALRRGTQLLVEQRGAVQAKEEGFKTREGELRNIATELEKQAKRLAERESQITRQRNQLAEEETRRKLFKDNYEAKERELVGKEQRVKALEEDLKLREQHILGLEMDIKECPYCNVRYDLEGISELIDEVRGYGLDLSALDNKYKEALDHMDREAYDKALESARGILRELKTIREDVLAKGIKYLVGSAGRTVTSAREKGLDTTEAEKLLGQAKKAMEEKDCQVAEHYAKEAEYIARDLLKQESSQVQPQAAVAPEAAPPSQPEEEPAPGEEEQQYPSMYPPPQEEEQPEETAPPPPSTDKIYNCNNCFAAFKIGSTQRPVKVTCRSCGTGMIISD